MYLIRHGLFLGVIISEIFRSDLLLARKMQKTKNWKQKCGTGRIVTNEESGTRCIARAGPSDFGEKKGDLTREAHRSS